MASNPVVPVGSYLGGSVDITPAMLSLNDHRAQISMSVSISNPPPADTAEFYLFDGGQYAQFMLNLPAVPLASGGGSQCDLGYWITESGSYWWIIDNRSDKTTNRACTGAIYAPAGKSNAGRARARHTGQDRARRVLTFEVSAVTITR